MAFQSSTAWGLSSDTAQSWTELAQCRGLDDPEMMWPLAGTGRSVDEAVAVCHGCPVRIACLRDGVEAQDWDSVRGGLSGDERRDHHRAGLQPHQYPEHVRLMQPCTRCKKPFPRDQLRRWKRVCDTCRKSMRQYSSLPETIEQYRALRGKDLSRTAMAQMLGYATHHGLCVALRRAQQCGLITEDEL